MKKYLKDNKMDVFFFILSALLVMYGSYKIVRSKEIEWFWYIITMTNTCNILIYYNNMKRYFNKSE